MAFSHETVYRIWRRADGRCECRRPMHDHGHARCNRFLVWESRGREDRGAWEAHHIDANKGDTPHNCEILCRDCYKKTESFGKG